MRILMFSMTPLFADKSMGGAQKQLKKVALHLAKNGHDVTILCTQRSDAMHEFYWHENLRVLPVYRFKQPFPEPYATPTYNIAAAIQDTGDFLAQSDVFYSHDGGLIFPYIYQDTPTVVSLRSILFSETLQSGYLFQGGALIVPSQHTADAWLHSTGRFFPQLRERLHVIHNGLDFDVYKPTAPTSVLDVIPVDPSQHRIMLYPHRPEEPKGIRQTIELAARLVHQHGIVNLRVLVPKWIDTGLSASVREFYDSLERDIADRDLTPNFIFHDWVSDSMMPQYLSLGDLTVALGNYVETFGNVPYESLACGTPVIAARVGPYRDMLDGHIPMIDYGDIDAAAAAAAGILLGNSNVPAATTHWLHDNFQQSEMVAAYADLILNAQQQSLMPYQHTPLDEHTVFQLAPWCYITDDERLWHDFRGVYRSDADLIAAMGDFAAVDFKTRMTWYREGYIVPLQGQTS